MPKTRSVQDLRIRFVPADDPDFAARRQAARKQLIHMLAERIVAELLANPGDASAGGLQDPDADRAAKLQPPPGRCSPGTCESGQAAGASTSADHPLSDEQPQPPMSGRTAEQSPSGPLPEFLTSDELKDLTQARGIVKQQAMLTAEGIPFRVVRSRLLVSREHVRDWLRGVVRPPSRAINLDALRDLEAARFKKTPKLKASAL